MTRDRPGQHTSVEHKQRQYASKPYSENWLEPNIYIETIQSHIEHKSTSKIYTLHKVQNQALRLITGSMKSTPIRVIKETTTIQQLSKRRDMGNIIQVQSVVRGNADSLLNRVANTSTGTLNDLTSLIKANNRNIRVPICAGPTYFNTRM